MREWDPDQYLAFRRERTQPSIDLVNRIPVERPGAIIDIGCGPGNSTEVLLKRWPDAYILGLDKSEKMIDRARRDHPRQTWIVGDAAAFETAERFDIVFSNAAIHWIPDHDSLLKRLFGMLKENGVLAVQVPANQQSPLYRAIRRVSISRKWRAHTRGREAAVTYHSPDYYYERLAASASETAIWETTYYHVMDCLEDLIEWYRSTGMKPFLDSLPDEESRKEFEGEVLAELRPHYPPQPDGKVLYPFKRLFFIAWKKDQQRP